MKTDGSSPALERVIRTTTIEAVRRPGACDAVVVGAGAAGALAAQCLTEAGLRVLVLDAGWPAARQRSFLRRTTMGLVRRLSDPQGLSMLPARFVPQARHAISAIGRWRQPIQSTSYAWPSAPNAYVDDRDCPYVTPEGRPFVWIRARQIGGRMTIPWHGRQYYRLGPADFAPDDGLSPAWPFAASELDPWYAAVERRLGLTGAPSGVDWLPDSVVSTRLSFSPADAALRDRIVARWPDATVTLGRYAPPLPALEAAAATGRLLCRQGAIGHHVDVDETGRVTGITWVDEEQRSTVRIDVPLVFLCASALESTRILMLSRTARRPDGIGAASGVLGRYLMDHVYVKLEGQAPPYAEPEQEIDIGRCVYLPRFDARTSSRPPAGRGFGVQVSQFSGGWGHAYFVASSFGEMLPHPDNRVTLDADRRDAWDIPVLRIDCRHMPSELARAEAQATALRELADAVGVEFAQLSEVPATPGASVHECGTARMGRDAADSVLDPYNECWEAKGVYVTDAACFPSQAYQNPTLTIMALTARACDHAVRSAGASRSHA